MKKVVQFLLCAILGISLTSCQSLVESQIRKRLTNSQKRQDALLSSENMHVILLGTGGPLSNETRDSSGVISGDTVKTETLPKFAKDADLFLCESLQKEMVMMISRVAGELNNPRLSRQMLDVTDYHMSPVDAAQVVQEAGVKKLVLVHVVPPVENFIMRWMYLEGTDDAFDGEIVLGQDRASFELPPKSRP